MVKGRDQVLNTKVESGKLAKSINQCLFSLSLDVPIRSFVVALGHSRRVIADAQRGVEDSAGRTFHRLQLAPHAALEAVAVTRVPNVVSMAVSVAAGARGRGGSVSV